METPPQKGKIISAAQTLSIEFIDVSIMDLCMDIFSCKMTMLCYEQEQHTMQLSGVQWYPSLCSTVKKQMTVYAEHVV